MPGAAARARASLRPGQGLAHSPPPAACPPATSTRKHEAPVTDALSVITSEHLKPYTYYKGSKLNVEPSETERKYEMGFIAQDVARALLEAVRLLLSIPNSAGQWVLLADAVLVDGSQ